jgi:hypothetical protein
MRKEVQLSSNLEIGGREAEMMTVRKNPVLQLIPFYLLQKSFISVIDTERRINYATVK